MHVHELNGNFFHHVMAIRLQIKSW